ncbi:MAG: metal ABC transporter substrate-binding protein, partial [Solirubrobacteraceae bacterium]
GAVAGPDADVVGILPPNTDAHDFEPRPADVRDTAEAKLVFTSGQRLDGWMGDVVEQSGGDPEVVDLSERLVDRVPGETEGEEASRYDPHWWHDPANVQPVVVTIRDALAKADSDGRAGYQRRAAAYLAKVSKLDGGIRRCMSAVAPGERKLVTDHDAFGYFAKRYGIEVVGAVIPSQTTQAQPSAGELADLRQVIEREGVNAVFPEESVNARAAQAIARETGASSQYRLYGDSLGPEGSSGATYLKMELANADAMVRGFTGGARGCGIAGL